MPEFKSWLLLKKQTKNQKKQEQFFEASAPAQLSKKKLQNLMLIFLENLEKVKLDHTIEKRDLTKSGDAGLVPQGFYDQIIAKLDENAVVRQFATVVNTASGEDIKFPQITAHSSASLVAEGGAIGESDPTSASVTLGAFKYAYLVQVSSELLADEGVDIEGFLSKRHQVVR